MEESMPDTHPHAHLRKANHPTIGGSSTQADIWVLIRSGERIGDDASPEKESEQVGSPGHRR
jgi:hypothetical protein